METHEARRDFCARLPQGTAEQLAPYRHAGITVAPDSCLRFAPASPAKLVADLEAAHSAEALRKTGLFMSSAQGPLQLNSTLQARDACVLLLKTSEDGVPFVFLTENMYRPSLTSLRMLLHDHETLLRMKVWRDAVIVTEDLAGTIKWRQLGFAAAPVFDLPHCSAEALIKTAGLLAGLETANFSEFDAFHPYYCLGREPQPPHREGWLFAPVWDPVTFTPKPVEELLRLVHENESRTGCDFGPLVAWAPNDHALHQLALAAARDSAQFPELLHDSFQRDLRLVDAIEQDVERAHDPPTPEQLLQDVAAAVASGIADEGDLQAAREAMLRAREKEIVTPLREAGAACGDPADRNLWDMLAEAKSLALRITCRWVGSAAEYSAADVSQFVGLQHQQLKIVAALDRTGRRRRRRRR